MYRIEARTPTSSEWLFWISGPIPTLERAKEIGFANFDLWTTAREWRIVRISDDATVFYCDLT